MISAIRVIALIAFALISVACEPDWDALTEGTPSLTCDANPVEDARGTVPKGECWRVVALSTSTSVRLEGESCTSAASCRTAIEGETVVPMVELMTSATNEDFEVVTWPCDELESACQ